MLETGFAAPYFIWPNLNPFMKFGSIVEAVPDINDFQEVINKSKRLRDARNFVKRARDLETGIFDKNNPLLLLNYAILQEGGYQTDMLDMTFATAAPNRCSCCMSEI
jgi:hypothetical protein